MFEKSTTQCTNRPEQDQRLADAAFSPQAEPKHQRMAMPYKAQLALLPRRQFNCDRSLQNAVVQPFTANDRVQPLRCVA
jgi:hypothetical protein